MIKNVDFKYVAKMFSAEKKDDYVVNSFDGEWFIYGEDRIVGRYYFGNNEFTGLNECYVDLLFGDCSYIDKSFIHYLSDYVNDKIKHLEYDVHLFFVEYNSTLDRFDQLSADNILNCGVNYVITSVEKKVSSESQQIFDEKVMIRPFVSTDRDNVLSCLMDSHKMGIKLEDYGDLVDYKVLEENIFRYYDERFTLKDTVVFIAEQENEFVGHITFEIHNGKGVLIDSYVLNKFSGNGVYDLLNREFENYCFCNDVSVLEGSVEPHSVKAEKILKSLKENNWREKSFIGRFNIL